jgi:hypothetical protein
MLTTYKSAISNSQRWSRNAVAAKERKRIARATSPQAESLPPEIVKVKPLRFAVKINLERRDGQRIQFTCHRIADKIYHNGKLVSAKGYFRRLGQIAELWSMD